MEAIFVHQHGYRKVLAQLTMATTNICACLDMTPRRNKYNDWSMPWADGKTEYCIKRYTDCDRAWIITNRDIVVVPKAPPPPSYQNFIDGYEICDTLKYKEVLAELTEETKFLRDWLDGKHADQMLASKTPYWPKYNNYKYCYNHSFGWGTRKIGIVKPFKCGQDELRHQWFADNKNTYTLKPLSYYDESQPK